MLHRVRLGIVLAGLVAVYLALSSFYAAQMAQRRSLPQMINKSPPCDPYRSPGYLTANLTPSDLDNNRWHPFNAACSTPRLLRAVINREPLEWLRNRTVVLYGSSVDRNHLTHFCDIVKGSGGSVPYSHPLSPTPERDAQVACSTMPHYCCVAEYDFCLASSFHYGMDPTGERWTNMQGFYTPPGKFEDRLEQILLPFLVNLRRPSAIPDLIEVSSFEWDMQYWITRSWKNDAAYYDQLVTVELPIYIWRLSHCLHALLRTFPRRTGQSPILFRLPHEISRKFPGPRISFLLDQAARAVIDTPPFRDHFEVGELGSMLRGSTGTAWMDDQVHPAKFPGSYVWGDYILMKLKNAVEREQHNLLAS